MPKFYTSIPPDIKEWALAQKIFFTASAPLHGSHVNLSPKGLPSSTFSILNPNLVAYLDLTGSGAETIAHIYENGRLTILFISFDMAPRILRLFCQGRVIERGTGAFDEWTDKMGIRRVAKSTRAVIVGDVFKTQTSCGYGVPLFQHLRTFTPPTSDNEEEKHGRALLGDRETLNKMGDHKVDTGSIDKYQAEWNSSSLDGLPGLRSARKFNGERMFFRDVLSHFKKTRQWETFALGILVGWVIFGLLGLGSAVC